MNDGGNRGESMAGRLLGRAELVGYAWPPLLASVGGIAVGLTDSLLVSYYSTSALAGVALGAAIYELPVNALLGGLMAYRILAPRLGRGDAGVRETYGLRTVLSRLLPAAAGLAVATCIVSWFWLARTTDPAAAAALAYSGARAPSLILETLSSALVVTLVVWGRTRVPLLVFALSAPANLAFDAVLVYGIGPLPALGALGSGVGSTLSAVLPVPVLLVLLRRHRPDPRPEPRVVDNYIGWARLAWPAVGSAVVDYGGNIVFTAVLSLSGAAALAGMRFGVQLHMLVFMVISSASSAALYILGKDVAENRERIRDGVGQVRRTFLLVGGAVGVVVLVMGTAVSPLVSPDPAVDGAFRLSVVIVAGLCPIAGVTYADVTLLRLFGMTGREFVGNALGVWAAQVPVALVLATVSDGVLPFVGLAAYWVLRCATSRAQVSRYVVEAEDSRPQRD